MERAEFIEKLAALYEPSELRNKLARFKEANGGGMTFYELDDEMFERVVNELPLLMASAAPFLPVAGSDPLRAKQLAYLVTPGDDKAGRIFKQLQDELATINGAVKENSGGSIDKGLIPAFEKKLAFVQRTQRFLEAVAAAGELPWPKDLAAAGFTANDLVDLQVLASGVEPEAPAAPPAAVEAEPAETAVEIDAPISLDEFNRRANLLLRGHEQFWNELGRNPLYAVLHSASDEAFETFIGIDLPTMFLAARAFEAAPNNDYMGRTLARKMGHPASLETELAEKMKEAVNSVMQTMQGIENTSDPETRARNGKKVSVVAVRLKKLIDVFNGQAELALPGTVAEAGGDDAVFAQAMAFAGDTFLEDQAALREQLDALHAEIYQADIDHGDIIRQIAGRGTSISTRNSEEIQAFRESLVAFTESGLTARWQAVEISPEQYAEFFHDVRSLGERFEANLGDGIGNGFDSVLEEAEKEIASKEILDRTRAIGQLYHLRRLLDALSKAFPDHGKKKMAEFRARLDAHLKKALPKVITGKIHEKNLNRVRFSQSLPASDDIEPDFATTLDLSRPVYMHIFADLPLAGMVEFGHGALEWNGNSILFGAVEKEIADTGYQCVGDSGYLCASILPEHEQAELSRSIGNYREFLMGLAGGTHEVTVTMSLDTTRKIEEKIVIDATKTDAPGLSARIDQAIAAAEDREAARALLPEIFTEPFVPMEAAGFEPETLEPVLTKCIPDGGKLVAVRMHSPSAGFTIERNALKHPISRVTSSYASLLYELDGKYFVMPEAVMFCQNYNQATGEFGPAMRPLFLQSGYQYRIKEPQLARLRKN